MVIQIELKETGKTFIEVRNFLIDNGIVFFDMENSMTFDKRIFIEISNNCEELIEDLLNNFFNQHLTFNSDDFIMIF
jgi:hypothetical protein